MTHVILRAHVRDEDAFANAVSSFAKELHDYDQHIEKCRRGEADYYPPPTAPADVSASVRRSDFTPDYIIVDSLAVERGDIRALENRKNEFRQKVAMMENEAINNLLPRGKWRLAGIEYNLAASKEEDQRTDADNSIIDTHINRITQLNAIHHHHAKMEAEIEDLNFDTINSWSPTPFK